MKRIISFALGNLWRWSKSPNRGDLIAYAKELKIDGLEITFSSKEELYAFGLSKNDERWLKSLEHVTIHAPFEMIRGAASEQEIIEQLKIIAKLYQNLNAQNVIIHPQDLPDAQILNQFHFNVSTENLSPKSKITIPKLKKIFKAYPQIGLCLDVSHAYLWSQDETPKLVQAFADRITQIHFSGTYRRRDHQSLGIVSNNFLASLAPIFKLNAPIVIEEDMPKRNIDSLLDEVRLIREMFDQ